MIQSDKNTNTNNRRVESFNDSRASRSYNASASMDIDLRKYDWCGLENGSHYVINDANPTLVQPYVFHEIPYAFTTRSLMSPTRRDLLSQLRSLQMLNRT